MGIATYNPLGSPVINSTAPVGDDASSSEAERFEKLTGKLLQVPKSELDQKVKES